MKSVFLKKTFNGQSAYVSDVSSFTCLNRKSQFSFLIKKEKEKRNEKSRWIIRSEADYKIFACTSKSSKKAWMLFISNYNAYIGETAVRWKLK